MVLTRLGALMPGGFKATFSVPTLTADQTNVGFVSEVGAATEGQPTSGLVTFAPRRVSTQLEVSLQAVIQGGALMDFILSRLLYGRVNRVIQDAAINGDGTNDTPIGVRAASGVANVVGGTDGAQFAWSHVLDLEAAPALADAEESGGFSGYLTNPTARRWLKKTPRASGLPFIWDGGNQLNGHRAFASTSVPANLSKGTSTNVCSSLLYGSDWRMLLLPIFGVPGLLVDAITQAHLGKVRLTLDVFMACGVLRPASFAKMDDGLTA